MRPEVAFRPPGGKDPETSWVDGPGHEWGLLFSEPHPQRLREPEQAAGALAESPPAFVFRGRPLHLRGPLGKRVAEGTAQQCHRRSGGSGACPELPSNVPLEDAGCTSQEASAQFSNQVGVCGP